MTTQHLAFDKLRRVRFRPKADCSIIEISSTRAALLRGYQIKRAAPLQGSRPNTGNRGVSGREKPDKIYYTTMRAKPQLVGLGRVRRIFFIFLVFWFRVGCFDRPPENKSGRAGRNHRGREENIS